MSYSYDRTGRGANVPQTVAKMAGETVPTYARTARAVPFTLKDVEQMRKDVLTLMKNVDRVTLSPDGSDYETMRRDYNTFRVALRKWAEHYHETIYKELVPRITVAVRIWLTGSDRYSDNPYFIEKEKEWANYWDKKLRENTWDLYINLSPPSLERWLGEKKKWGEKVKREARKAWSVLTEFLTWLNSKNVAPTREERSVEKVRIEGFDVTVIGHEGDEYSERSMEIFKEALKMYRRMAGAIFPALLRKQIPMQFRYDCRFDLGGQHLGDHIDICAAPNANPKEMVKTMAHEMGHHLYKSLSGEQTSFWSTAMHRDLGDLDLRDLVKEMHPGESVWDAMERFERSNPILALQLQGVMYGFSGHQIKNSWKTREELEAYLSNGGDPLWVVPKHPVSGYSSKNPEEAFCEVVGHLVAYGPQTVHPLVRSWFQTILPGAVRLARTSEKQASRDEDARALAAGEKTPEQLRAENGKFAFPNASVNWSSARRLW